MHSKLIHSIITPAHISETINLVEKDSHGAAVLFLGHVRNHARGQKVNALFYECYEKMALKFMHQLEIGYKKQDISCAILQRMGKCKVGECSIIIATSSAHRDDAYRANREILELLKKDCPVWKKEFYENGETWVGYGAG